MARPVTREDFFDYHVKRIFRRLREVHKHYETDDPFDENWINNNVKEAGDAFLDDVMDWMGIEEAIDESGKK